jgi:L-iditol 2-dehydrogenase
MDVTMKAVVKFDKGKGNMEIRQVNIPKIKNNEVLIKIKAASVCGSDIHIWEGEHDLDTPIIMGHEFSGQIVEVGSEVKNYKVSDRVVGELRHEYCKVCKLCKQGNTHLCYSKKAPGFQKPGFYAEYVTMPEEMLHRIPDNVSFEEASMCEPAAVVLTGLLELTKIEPEDIVVIIGAGPIGLIAQQMAKIAGARAVVMVAYNKIRVQKSKELNIDYFIDDRSINVKDFMDNLTNGLGADVVVDCTGTANGINLGIDILRKLGRLCIIGYPVGELSINMQKAVYKAINIICTYATTGTSWDRVLSMLERGALDLGTLISHREPLENYEKIYLETKNKKGILLPEKGIDS